MRRPLAVIGFSCMTTLWILGKLGERTAVILAALSVLSIAVLLGVRKLRKEAMALCVCFSVLASALAFVTAYETTIRPVLSLSGTEVTVTAHLENFPMQSGETYCYELRTDTINGRRADLSLLVFSRTKISDNLSDSFSFRGILDIERIPNSPTLSCSAHGYKAILVSAHPETFTSRMLRMRQYIRSFILPNFPHSSIGSVLYALLTGDKQLIPKDTYARMQSSGIVHIFAVSGLHLSVFSMAILLFLKKKNAPQILRLLLPLLPVVFFLWITGFSKSCVRAGIMLVILLLGQSLFRKSDAINSLGLAVMLISMASPLEACELGFTLSAIGCLTVIIASPAAEKLTSRVRFRPKAIASFVRAFLTTFLVSASVGICILPVLVLEVGSFSLVSPLANAALMWVVEWAMVLTAVSVLLSFAGPLLFLWKATLLLAGILARYCVAVSDFFGGFRFSSVTPERELSGFLIALFLLLVSFAILLPMEKRKKILYTTGICSVILVFAVSLTVLRDKDSVRITIADTPDSVAVLVQSEGENVLIGCGDAVCASQFVRGYAAEISHLLLPGTKPYMTAGAGKLVREMPVRRVTVPGRVPSTEPMFFFAEPSIRTNVSEKFGYVQIESIAEPDASAVYLRMHGKTMLLLFYPGCNLQKIPASWLSADVLYCRNDIPPALESEKYGMVLLSCDAWRKESLAKAGTFRNTRAFFAAGQGDLRMVVTRNGEISVKEGV